MKYKVKWIEEHMGITRNMIRRYEKKGVISKTDLHFRDKLVTINSLTKFYQFHLWD